ncbi:MAG: hypothetical protein ACTSP6_06060 [Promethearchaeota archaeon]
MKIIRDQILKIRLSKEEKQEFKNMADRMKISMSALGRIKLFQLITSQSSPQKINRPWEVKESDFSTKNKKGRKLPLIPGSPQWKSFEFAKSKIAVRNELKEILAKRRSLIEQEEKLLGDNYDES